MGPPVSAAATRLLARLCGERGLHVPAQTSTQGSGSSATGAAWWIPSGTRELNTICIQEDLNAMLLKETSELGEKSQPEKT